MHRTIPFTLACQSIATLSYATAGYHTADVTEHRAKAEPSTAEMIAKLRQVLIAAKYRPVHPAEPGPGGIHAVQRAWEGTAGCTAPERAVVQSFDRGKRA